MSGTKRSAQGQLLGRRKIDSKMLFAAGLVLGVLLGGIASYALVTRTNSTKVTTTSTSLKYYVVLQQQGFCVRSPTNSYESLWSVTLGNMTQKVPANSTAPINDATVHGSPLQNFSIMIFSVPDGTYNFTIQPDHFSPDSGTITVAGANVFVMLNSSIIVDYCLPSPAVG